MLGDPYIASACLLRGRELRLRDKGGRFIARLGKRARKGGPGEGHASLLGNRF